MKTVISLILSLSFCFFQFAHRTTPGDIEKEILQAWKETFTYEIDATSITRDCTTANQIDGTILPFTITSPGLYCLTNILTPNTGNFVISIASSNVVLDLNDNFIQTSGSIPAIIANAQSNIIIRGGSIVGSVTTVAGGNGVVLTNCSKTILDTLNISSCSNGAFITNITDSFIDSCSFYNNTTALNVNVGQFLIINGCIASRNGQGFYFVNCANFFLEECFANNNGAQGFINSLGKTFQFVTCTANGNNQGFVLDRSAKDSFLYCTSTDNTTYGFNLNTTGLSMISATSKGNNVGFNLQGTSNIVFQALAENNAQSGFLLNSLSSFYLVRECTAMGNNIGFNNQGTNNRLYSNFSENNKTNYVNVPNVVVSPTATTPINFTANIDT